MSNFREPPFFSVTTPMAALMAVARGLGLSKPVLVNALRHAAGKSQKAKVFAGYTPTEHDVFLTVYSKSGTNWLMQIMTQLIWDGAAEFTHIHDLVAWPDAIFPNIAPLHDDRQWKAAPHQLRSIKTALESEYVPYSENARYVSILRDPKEIFISNYYFVTRLFGMQKHIPMDEWFEEFVSDDFITGNWADHSAGYWAWRDRPNVLILNYHDLITDLGAGVRQCAEFLGLEPSETVLAAVIERASFSYMKARTQAFDPPRFLFVREEDRSTMMRGGATRAKREQLSAEQRARIDDRFTRRLEELGCDLPYAKFFMQS